jgi:hypothetical protein
LIGFGGGGRGVANTAIVEGGARRRVGRKRSTGVAVVASAARAVELARVVLPSNGRRRQRSAIERVSRGSAEEEKREGIGNAHSRIDGLSVEL